jgi:peptidoglycan hydrolase CwlO-like protein
MTDKDLNDLISRVEAIEKAVSEIKIFLEDVKVILIDHQWDLK